MNRPVFRKKAAVTATLETLSPHYDFAGKKLESVAQHASPPPVELTDEGSAIKHAIVRWLESHTD